MKSLPFLSVLLFFTIIAKAQFITKKSIQYSRNVGDSFEIYISTPPGFTLTTSYNVVYYCDANLKSGKLIQQMLSGSEFNEKLKHTIFVGIGHIGNFHVLRRRDFILPSINGTDTAAQSKNYGQVENFYAFLKEELIPDINTQFNTNKQNNAIIGHSLGGLFAFYCLFQSDDLFAKYFALSPALWIDKYAIYRFNKIDKGFADHKYLYFASGSKETVNKILHGTDEAKVFLDTQKYSNLQYEYDIHKGETHNSEVPLSLKKIFNEKL